LLPKQNFEELKQKLFAAVSVFQKANPLLPGMSREAAQKQLGRNAGAASFQTSLAELLSEKRLQTEGEFLRVAGTGVSLQSDEIRAREEIVQAFA
ncbi:hypothetical protein NL529_27620, partial [Klebsiella pneumoniae]|nr:hypothetical protein [Klebsiella pneumoniae]